MFNTYAEPLSGSVTFLLKYAKITEETNEPVGNGFLLQRTEHQEKHKKQEYFDDTFKKRLFVWKGYYWTLLICLHRSQTQLAIPLSCCFS